MNEQPNQPNRGQGPLFDDADDGGNPFANAEVIYAYTRAQAIEEGVLVDASALAREAGITFPVAITHTVWSQFIEPSPDTMGLGQSTTGRLWDVLHVLRHAIRTASPSRDQLRFKVLFVMSGNRRRLVELKALCGPGDDAKPVITVMFPEED